MSIRTRRFALELTSAYVFLRLPFIGQAFVSLDGAKWDRWSTLRATGEV